MNEYDAAVADMDAQPQAAPSPAATPQTANEYDAAVGSMVQEDERKRKFAAWLSTRPNTTPDQAAEANRLSQQTGLDPAFVGDNLDKVRAQLGQQKVEQHLAVAPPLSVYMQDPARARAASDDTGILSQLYQDMSGNWNPKDVVYGLTAKAFGVEDWSPLPADAPRFVRELGESVDEQRMVYLRALASIPKEVTPSEKAYLEANGLPMPSPEQLQARGLDDGQKSELAKLEYRSEESGKAKQFESLPEKAVYGALRMGPAMLGALGVGAAGTFVGGPIGAGAAEFAFWKYQTYGAAWRELSQLKDADGNPLLSIDEARSAADLGSTLAGGLMVVPGGMALKSIPGVKQAMARVGISATAQLMERTTLPKAIGYLALRYGEGVAGGALLMAAQTATTGTVRELERSKHGQEPDWGRVRDETASALYEGAVSMALMAGWGPGRDFLRDLHELKNPVVEQTRLDRIIKLAQESKLLERDPVEARKLFAEFTVGDNAATHVHADVEAWDQYWKAQGADPEEAAARILGDGGKAYTAAKASGDKISIPMADYVAKLAPKGHAEALRADVTLSQEGLTPRQAEKEAKRRAQAMAALPSDPEKMDVAHRAVYDAIFERARAAGVSKLEAEHIADINSRPFKVWGEKIGVSPLELFERQDLFIHRGEGTPAQQGAARAASENLSQLYRVFDQLRLLTPGPRGMADVHETLRDHFAGLAAESAEPGEKAHLERQAAGYEEQRKQVLADLAGAPEAAPENAGKRAGLLEQARQLLRSMFSPDQALNQDSVRLREGIDNLRGIQGVNPDPAGVNLTRVIGGALEAYSRLHHPVLSITEPNPLDPKKPLPNEKTKQLLAKWMAEEVAYEYDPARYDKSGAGWYTYKYQRALDAMAELFPTFNKDSPEFRQADRDMFTLAVAITSSGLAVDDNMVAASRAFQAYLDSSKNPEKRRFPEGTAQGESRRDQSKAFERVNALLDEHGTVGIHKYLMREGRVGDLLAEQRARGDKKASSDYGVDERMPVSATEIGPKTGVFYANLMGAQGYLTMDMWWMRTIGRMLGDLVERPTREGLDSFKQALGDPSMSDHEALDHVMLYEEAYAQRGKAGGKTVETASKEIAQLMQKQVEAGDLTEKQRDRMAELFGHLDTLTGDAEEGKSGYKHPFDQKELGAAIKQLREAPSLNKADQAKLADLESIFQQQALEKSAHTLYKAAFAQLQEKVGSQSTRSYWIRTAEEAQRVLAKQGIKITLADLQATLWYGEKRLYGAMGVKGKGAIGDFDFSDVTKKVIDRVKKGEFDPIHESEELSLDHTESLPEEPERKTRRLAQEGLDLEGEIPLGQLDLGATQEMTPLQISQVGVPEGGRVKDGEATVRASEGGERQRTGAVDPNAQTQELPTFFRSWFKGSKVTDESGKPLVVFHGTKADEDFTSFKPGYAEVGFHFGTPEAANQRLEHLNEYVSGRTGPDRVYPVFLSIKHPLELRDDGYWSADKVRRLAVEKGVLDGNDDALRAATNGPFRNSKDLAAARDAVVKALEAKGYDGIKYTNDAEARGSTSWVAFRPEQVKSATGNRGTYDPNSPHILEQPGKLTLVKGGGGGPDLSPAGMHAKVLDLARERINALREGIANGSVTKESLGNFDPQEHLRIRERGLAMLEGSIARSQPIDNARLIADDYAAKARSATTEFEKAKFEKLAEAYRAEGQRIAEQNRDSLFGDEPGVSEPETEPKFPVLEGGKTEASASPPANERKLSSIQGDALGASPRALWDKIEAGEVRPEDLSRKQLQDLLQWNDPNGVWSEEAVAAEGLDPNTKEELVDQVKTMIWENRPAGTELGGSGVNDLPPEKLEQGGKAASLADLESSAAGRGINVSVTENDARITLHKIVVPKESRGEGVGSAWMRELTSYADSVGKTVTLDPSTDFGATSRGRLVDFCKRFGFVENKGRNRDLEISADMYRPPKAGNVLEQGERRGYIEISTGAGGRKRFDIRLLASDRSTLAHEMFHFLTEVFGDLAKQSPELAQDFDTLAKGMGYKDAADRAAQRDVAKEERATHLWEQYLAEGKAPTRELQPVFARFKGWLRSIYKGITGVADQYQRQYGQPLQLSDEVRGVFDRLLASEKEIKDAQRQAERDKPLPIELEEKQKAEYDKVRAAAADESEQEFIRRSVEGTRKENAKWAKEERARIADGVNAKLLEMPEYRALSAARDGQLLGLDVPPGFKDLDEVKKAIFPDNKIGIDYKAAGADPELRDRLDKQWPGLFSYDGGAHPDALAALVGATSGADLLASLDGLEPRSDRVARETKQAMAQEHPELMQDPQGVSAAALDSVHSDAQAKATLYELRMLAKAFNPRAAAQADRVSLADLKFTADRLVADRKIYDLAPERHLAAERGAAQRAFDLAGAGKMAEAYAAKEQQLLSMFLYRATRDAAERAEKIQAKLEQSAGDPWRGSLGKADPIYRDAHDALLELVGIGEQQPKGVAQVMPALAAFFDLAAKQAQETPAELKELLDAVAAAPGAAMQGGSLGFKGLTLGDAELVHDAVVNIKHLAKQSTEVQLAERRAEFADLKGRLISEGEANLPFMGKAETDKLQKSWLDRALEFPEAFDAVALGPKQILEMIGPTGKSLFDAYIERRNYKEQLAADVLSHYEKIWEAMPKDLRKTLHDAIPGLEKELPIPDDVGMSGQVSRQWLLMVALNFGNQGNRDRMCKPLGWTEAQVKDVINKYLSKPEMDFVQGVFDYSDKELWPLIAAKEERKTGLAPPKVEATPIETPHGTYAGGYFPAKYDPRQGISTIGARQEGVLATPSEFYSPSYARAATAKSHTKARAENYTDVVNLDFGVIQSHLSQVIHDLAFDEFVRDTSRLLLDKDVQQMMAQRLGEDRAKQPMAWLSTVANAQADSNAQNLGKLQQGIGILRSAVAMAAMGGSIPVAIGQLAHPLFATAIGKIPVRHAVPGFLSGFTPGGLKFALENFTEAQHRRDHYVTAMRETFGDMAAEGGRGPVGNALETVRRVSYFSMEAADRITTAQVGLAAYNEALAKGASHDEACAHANDVIQDVMPTHERAEQSALLRDKGAIGSLLMFHGFLNKVYGLTREQAHKGYLAVNDPNVGKLDASWIIAKAAGRILGSIAVGIVGGEYLMGHGKEDDETWGDFALRKAVTAPFRPIPFAGDIAEGIYNKTLAEHPKKADMRQAPMLALFQSIGDLATKAGDEKKTDSERAWALVELLLTGARLPARQVTRTGKYLTDLATGDEQANDAFDVTSGLIYGSRKKQPSNPVRDAQAALQ